MKKVIAVDLDDVLASSAQNFVEYSNKRWGTRLTVEDYDEHWGEMWGIDHRQTKQRADHIYRSKIQADIKHFDDAQLVLKKLTDKYKLVITTSRHRLVQKITEEWLDTYFKGVFDNVHFAGIWDQGHDADVAINLTKAELCRKVGATYLIDDHPKHCFAAAEVGVDALLFGDYRWNRSVTLPERVTRVRDWQEVERYFYAKS